MHKFTLSAMVASLMVLGGAVQAQSLCETLGDSPAVGLCNAYCVHMDCDLINDGDPFSSPQASEAACRNVAASFLSLHTGVSRTLVDIVAAIKILDGFCTVTCPDGEVPPCV